MGMDLVVLGWSHNVLDGGIIESGHIAGILDILFRKFLFQMCALRGKQGGSGGGVVGGWWAWGGAWHGVGMAWGRGGVGHGVGHGVGVGWVWVSTE